MTPDEAEQRARITFFQAGTAFFRVGQVAAWVGIVYALVAVLQRVTG